MFLVWAQKHPGRVSRTIINTRVFRIGAMTSYGGTRDERVGILIGTKSDVAGVPHFIRSVDCSCGLKIKQGGLVRQ
jgi:hypothetical protein